MYQHILVAIDLGNNAKVVLAKAKAFQKVGAHLRVVHVCQGRVTGYGEATSNNHIANDIQLKQAIYPAFKAVIESSGLVDVEKQLLTGDVADVLHKIASEGSCDLIIVGSHGTEGVKTLLGSTAHAVLQGASCDVLTINIDD